VRELERQYPVFTHMTPSYGSFKGCITVKGIITVTSSMEVKPCPYIDFSLGNLRQTSLREILARGMRNPWLGPYRPDCLIGEDPEFIRIHLKKTAGVAQLPVPWGQGFSDADRLGGTESAADANADAFDPTGRCRPGHLDADVLAAPRNHFHLVQPSIDYATVHARSVAAFGAGELPDPSEFQRRADDLLARLRLHPTLAGVLRGVRVPFLLPRTREGDIGEQLATVFLPRVAAAFAARFAESPYTDHCQGRLADALSVAFGSRHDRLLAALAEGAVVGWYFPCLAGYSVPAMIERVQTLPEDCLLAGGYDTCAAFIGSPDLLSRHDGYPPLLWMAALTGSVAGEGFHFESYGSALTFNRRKHFSQAAEYWNGGLVLIG
jgi:hypothetical protein